jgi:hypothetical protein
MVRARMPKIFFCDGRQWNSFCQGVIRALFCGAL